jgi:hypothetical protein
MRAYDFSTAWSADGTPATESTVSLANNQAATNLTGVLFDNTVHRGAIIEMYIRRKTDSSERNCHRLLKVSYDTTAAAWRIDEDTEENNGTASGVTLSLSSGQVQYATDNQAGTNYAGLASIAIRRFNA